MTPIRMDLWYMDRETEERHCIPIKPKLPVTPNSLMRQLAPVLQQQVLPVALYYYAVMVVLKADGTEGYRTFLPKTVV